MADVKFRSVTPPAFRRASERDPSELPECLDRMKKFLLDRVEQDCRSFARAIAEWRDNKLWEHFNGSWEEFVAEHIKRPIEWVEHMIIGVSILDGEHPIPAQNAIDASKALAVARTVHHAQKADPTLERKDGGNNNPHGLGGKSGKQLEEDCHRYHDNGDNSKPSTRGVSPAYLAQRIAESDPEIHEAMKRGEYTSARAAAVAAGIVRPRQTFSVSKTTQPKSLAKSLHDRLPPEFLEQLYQELGDLLTSDRQD